MNEQFFEIAVNSMNNSRNALTHSDDADYLQFHLTNLEFLCRAFCRILQNYNENNDIYLNINNHLIAIYQLMEQLDEKVSQLTDNTFFQLNNFVIKLNTGGRSKLEIPKNLLIGLKM